MEELIEFVTGIIRNFRLGMYFGKNGRQYDGYGRTTVHPSWCEDPLTEAKRVSSPILDVKPPSGSTAAVISLDGIPGHPVNIGVTYDTSYQLSDQTVWVRADLDEVPGVLEVGANQCIRLQVGDKPQSVSQPAPQKIVIANDVVDVVEQTLKTQEDFADILQALNTYFVEVANVESTLNLGLPAAVTGSAVAGLLVTRNSAVALLRTKLLTQINTSSAKLQANIALMETIVE